MDIQFQKSMIIEQFNQINDINLQSMLIYALVEKKEDFEISQWQKDIVRERIKKSDKEPERLLDWDSVKDNFILD